MPRLRLLMLALGLIALAWSSNSFPHLASAQVNITFGQKSGSGATVGLNLADRELVKRLRTAEQMTEKGDHSGAVAQLQFILNLEQDGFFRPADELAGRFVSLKQQADLMLSRASPDGKRAYENQFGAEARKLFDQAVGTRNVKLGEQVMRRFAHTAAGADAIHWLGSYHMDRADYDSALQCLLRLRRLPAGARFEPLLSLRAGLCLYRTGRVERAQELIRETASNTAAPIKFGGQTFPANAADQQILAWLKSASPATSLSATEPTGWLMPRGNLERNRLLHSSPPVGKSLWHTSLTDWKVSSEQQPDKEVVLDVGQQIQALRIVHTDKGIAPLPAASPLLINDVVVARFYDHIAGFNARTGQELWRSAETDRIFQLLYKNLNSKENVSNQFNGRPRSPRELFSLLLRQRAWDDLTYGNLSSDGEFVFSVEDLGFMNDIMIMPRGGMVGTTPTHPLMMRESNRLCAYEARTGKLKWEVGGPRGEIALAQAGTFFLGPPLALEHQLMCLVEDQGLTQLLVLDSRTGKTLRTQILSQPNDNVLRDPNRRRAGLTPALMGDLLVCPTGTGLVVTVDLASQSLAWAYQYTAPTPPDGRDPQMIRMQMAMRGMPLVDMDPMRGAHVDEWQDGGPILAEGHVILTPRDSADLHCLSLEDGKVAWRKPRREFLYVAAVRHGLVILVGSRSVEALQLSDGTLAWSQPVAVMAQAGRGIVTENHILLPLTANEVLSVDLKTGRTLARTRIHDEIMLGNLIPGPGFIVSQSADNLSVFRTLDSVSAETAQRLAANPQDAEALSQRGEFRLSQGDLAGGQADLRQSLKLRKSADTQTILFESLLEGLQADFAGYRAMLGDLEQLAQTPKQRVALYRNWADGLLAAGDLSQSFDVLLKLSESTLGRPEMERLDGHRTMRRDQWIQAQVFHLTQKADEPLRNRIQTELLRRLADAAADKNDDGLRNYIRFFGSDPIANDARQLLADRLITRGYGIEAEQLLARLALHSDPRVAGRALALMARELIKVDRADESDLLAERLRKEFADIPCIDNKTGSQLVAEWHAASSPRARFANDWPTGRVEATRETTEMRNPVWSFDVPIDGDSGPFYRHSQFKTSQDETPRVAAINGWGEPQWVIPLSELGPIANISTYRAQVRNHVVLMTMGAQVCAVSTLITDKGIRAKSLWNSPLIEGSVGDQNQFFQIMVNRPGLFRPQANRFDLLRNPIGTVGAIVDDTVVILRGRHLILADLLTGAPLWRRTDFVPGSEIFGNAETIVVVPPDKSEGELIRRLDGTTIEMVPVPPQPSRILTINHSLLSFSRSLAKNALIFQLTDVPAEKVVWERSFDLQSQFTVISNSEMGVLEPNGQMSLVQLADGQVRWQQELNLAPNPKELWVLPDGDRLLAFNGEIPARNRPALILGNNQVLIDGRADCLDRATGKPIWSQRIDNVGFDYSLPDYLPFWFFAARTANVNVQGQKAEVQLLTIDKRSGQVLLKATETSYISSYQVKCDPEKKQALITMFGAPQSFQHLLKYTDQPVEGPPPPP